MSSFQVLTLTKHGDARGQLVVLENALPFTVERTFWITGADGQTRGGHRHKVTRQALVAISGQVDVLMDDGECRESIVLDAPHQCLIVEPKDWHTMQFGPCSILLVMASHRYERSDYIEAPYR